MRTRSLVLALLLATVPAPARAVLIQFSWSGTITAAEIGPVSVGDPASGSFLIDTETADQDSSDDRSQFSGALSTIAFDFGSYSGTAGANTLVLRDGPSIDNFTLSADASGPDLDGVPASTFVLDLSDPTLAALSSDAIPTSLDLEDFSNRFALLVFFDGEESFGLQSSITSLDYTVIPEPSGAALLGLGSLALGAARRASSRRVVQPREIAAPGPSIQGDSSDPEGEERCGAGRWNG